MAATFFGVGKSLPMWRGGGIDQPLLFQVARKAVGTPGGQRADWIHVYPEAGVYQWQNELGGRRNERRNEIGKLKWGVGKLIAHHPTNRKVALSNSQGSSGKRRGPIVIPFYFLGTETITPFDDPVHRKVKTSLPQFGQNVVLRFGPPIEFGDLIDEFERDELTSGRLRDGQNPLRVYTCCDNPLSPHHHHSTNLIENILSYLTILRNRILHSSSDSIDSSSSLEASRPDESLSSLMFNLETWKSTSSEKKLYHKITRRIEQKLEELGEQCSHDIRE